MQVVRSLRHLVNERIVLLILTVAQLLQPAGVKAQQADFVNEAQKLINEARSRLPSCDVLQSGQALIVPTSNTTRTRPAVTWNPRLASIAQSHSQSMAKGGFFDHVDTSGKTVAQRAKDVGYRYRVVAENIAAGHESLSEVVMEWIASKGHCENLIDDRVTEFGLSMVQNNDPSAPYSSYWTLVLGTPQR